MDIKVATYPWLGLNIKAASLFSDLMLFLDKNAKTLFLKKTSTNKTHK